MAHFVLHLHFFIWTLLSNLTFPIYNEEQFKAQQIKEKPSRISAPTPLSTWHKWHKAAGEWNNMKVPSKWPFFVKELEKEPEVERERKSILMFANPILADMAVFLKDTEYNDWSLWGAHYNSIKLLWSLCFVVITVLFAAPFAFVEEIFLLKKTWLQIEAKNLYLRENRWLWWALIQHGEKHTYR